MVRGCFSASAVGDIVKIDGIINRQKYGEILIHNVIPSGNFLIGNSLVIQHDNDPKRTANAEKSYLD